jgi:branched-chain amino acid transport system substrate-binding protein
MEMPFGKLPRIVMIPVVGLLFTVAGLSPSTSTRAAVVRAGGSLVIGEVNPFTGPAAGDGGEMVAGCFPATRLINQAGGVMGHPLNCLEVDTKDDPVDAVPAVRQLIATHSNLVGVLGPGSGDSGPTVPVLNNAKMTMFAAPGQSYYDRNSYTYFWRILPPDDAEGYAMALWAHLRHFTRAASIFANNTAAQTNVPTLLRGFKKLGGTITINQSIAQDQTSYRTEIQQMLATKPQVIFTEADPQTSATYLAELKQLHGNLPVIGSALTLEGQWLKAVQRALGSSFLNQYWTGIEPYAAQSGPAWKLFNQTLLDKKTGVPGASQYSGDPWSLSDYDGVNIMALAMDLTKSTRPAVYNSAIMRITSQASGAEKVYSYKQGVQAIKARKRFQYVGAFGPILFNKYHNSLGAFQGVHYGNNKLPTAGVMSASQLAALNR